MNGNLEFAEDYRPMDRRTYSLEPEQFLRSVDATRETLGRARMKLLDIVPEVESLIRNKPFAVVGGLAQILWARKTHTDDLDVALATADLADAYNRVEGGNAAPGWSLPLAPDRAHEADSVFEVYHLLFDGSVVDLLSFRDQAFTREIIETAHPVSELRAIRFIRPELLLVTHLLRPGATAALAAVELVVERRLQGGFDLPYATLWAERMGRLPALKRTLRMADDLSR